MSGSTARRTAAKAKEETGGRRGARGVGDARTWGEEGVRTKTGCDGSIAAELVGFGARC